MNIAEKDNAIVMSVKDERPTHVDLFSGIGGFALAASWAGFRTVAFCEKEPYCQKLLGAYWPEIPIYSDVTQFGGRPFAGVDLLTGGFPCQPVSVAGKRRGDKDDRWLWPEMFRVIQTVKPPWVVGENVAGLDSMGLETCLSNLEAGGYEVATFEIPACGIGAQHIRNRLWIVAHSNRLRELQQERRQQNERRRISNQDCALPDRDGIGRDAPKVQCGNALQSCQEKPKSGARTIPELTQPFPPTGEPLEALLTPDTCGTPYGLSDGMDRLKGLGNAIVPQVAYQIIKEIRKLI